MIFDIAKDSADKLADKFHQNTYARVPNPIGYLRLEIRQPIHTPYYSLVDIWLMAFKGESLRAAKSLSPHNMACIMSVPPAEQFHWLHPEKWDPNSPRVNSKRWGLNGIDSQDCTRLQQKRWNMRMV